jgi:hypothetical protein
VKKNAGNGVFFIRQFDTDWQELSNRPAAAPAEGLDPAAPLMPRIFNGFWKDVQ